MEEKLCMKDEGFKKECLETIGEMVQEGFDKINNKICQTYRKSLTECKLRRVRPWLAAGCWLANSCLLACSCLLFFLLEDYAKEVDRLKQPGASCPEDEVKVPTKKRLMDLFEMGPVDCDEQDARDVEFFYHVALAAVEKVIKSKTNMGTNDVWAVLETTKHWASSMSLALLLVDKLSELKNIVHNYKRNQDPEKPGKMKKEKMWLKSAVPGIIKAHFDSFVVFTDMQAGPDKFRNRMKFRLWESKVGIREELGATAARKRPSVQPFGTSSKRHTLEKQPARDGALTMDLSNEDGAGECQFEEYYTQQVAV
jgi:hypothetical protein